MAPHIHIDPFNGVTGDMLLCALVDLGAPQEAVGRAVGRVRLPGVDGISLGFDPVEEHGVQGLRLRVTVTPPEQPEHRTAAEIRRALAEASLAPAVRDRAVGALDRIAAAQARVRGVPAEAVRLGGIGGAQTLVALVGVAQAVEELGSPSVTCDPLPLGRGEIPCGGATVPGPAPATLEILKGVPVRGLDVPLETVTAVGAALVRTLSARVGPAPAMILQSVGTGFGARGLPDRPNCLRAWLGDAEEGGPGDLALLEANIDDLPGEILGTLIGAAMEAGALDAWITPVLMKKGRPAHVVSALCPAAAAARVEEALFRHSSTLGVRRSRWERRCLGRTWETAETPWGPVRVKVGRRGARVVNRAPEFEDCRRIALEHGVPLKDVYIAVWKAIG